MILHDLTAGMHPRRFNIFLAVYSFIMRKKYRRRDR